MDRRTQGTALRVATWNIQSALDSGRRRRSVSATASVIAGLNVAVLGLQEVDVRVPRSRLAHQARRLAGAMAWAYAPAMRVQLVGSNGNALLVRGRVLEQRRLRLSRAGSATPRSALLARVSVRGGVGGDGQGSEGHHVEPGLELGVAVCHLSVHEGQAVRQLDEATAALVDLADGGPCLLMGDLNLGGDAAAAVLLRHGLALTHSPPTYPATDPVAAIDHIAGAGIRLDEVHAIPTHASDHLPLVAELSPAGPGSVGLASRW